MEENTKGTGKSGIAYKIVIAILGLAIVYLVYDKIKTQKETTVLITQLEYSKTEKDSISNEFEALYEEYETLQINNDTLNRKLKAEQQRIKKIMDELKKTKASNRRQIEQYKEELKTVRKIMRSYIVQIDSLNTKNQKLMAENQKIKTDYEEAVNENQQLLNVKDSLTTKVEVASALKTDNLVAQILNSRDKPTSRVSKAEKFEICFTIRENDVVSKGKKTMYLRIARPDGNILLNENAGLFRFNNNEIAYSAKRDIDFKGKDLKTCVYYDIRQTLPEGNYTIDLFSEGNKIGTTIAKLK